MIINDISQLIEPPLSALRDSPLMIVAAVLSVGIVHLCISFLRRPSKYRRPSRRKNKPRINNHALNIKKSLDSIRYTCKLVSDGKPGMALYRLKKVNAYVFEEIVLSAFEKSGAKIYRSKSYSNDGGIDGRFEFNGDRYWVQSKRYRGHISNDHIKRHAEVCQKNDVLPVFVHTGKTGKKSRDTAAQGGVRIISGDRLLGLISGESSLTELLR